MKKMILLLLLALVATTIIGCSTIKGMGEDISTLGDWLTRGSEKATSPKTTK